MTIFVKVTCENLPPFLLELDYKCLSFTTKPTEIIACSLKKDDKIQFQVNATTNSFNTFVVKEIDIVNVESCSEEEAD